MRRADFQQMNEERQLAGEKTLSIPEIQQQALLNFKILN